MVSGRAAISEVAGKLLEQFGPNFAFVPEGIAVGHHGFGVLPWHAGPKDGPVAVTGADVAEIIEGKIARLWVMQNPPNALGARRHGADRRRFADFSHRNRTGRRPPPCFKRRSA